MQRLAQQRTETVRPNRNRRDKEDVKRTHNTVPKKKSS